MATELYIRDSSDPTGKEIYFRWSGGRNNVVEVWYNGEIIYTETNLDRAPNTTIGLSKIIDNFPNQSRATVGCAAYKNGGSLADPYAVMELTFDIPQNSATLPTVSMGSISSSGTLLDSYISKRSKIRTSVSNVTTKYSAGIKSLKIHVENKSYDVQNGVEVEIPLDAEGTNQKVYAEIIDTRGFSARSSEVSINVYSYDTPKIVPIPANEDEGVIVARADVENGNIIFDDSLEKLYICGKVVCSTIGGNNKCFLSYRKKVGISGDWQTPSTSNLLSSVSSGTEYNGIVSGDSISRDNTYYIELSVTDTVGTKTSTTYIVPSERVYMEKAGARGSIGSIAFGGHVSEDNAFEVYQNAYFRGGMYIDDIDGNKRYKITIGADGILRAEQTNTTYTLRRR